jgi:hypothetical protein
VISESPQKLGYDTWEIAIEEWENGCRIHLKDEKRINDGEDK